MTQVGGLCIGHGARVILVESSSGDFEDLSGVLSSAGFTVTVYDSGNGALENIEVSPPPISFSLTQNCPTWPGPSFAGV